MKVLKPDHLGIAVKNLDESIRFYTDVLGLKLAGRETLAARNVEIAFLECGETELELVQPTSPDSAVAKYIEKNGEGLYHLALRVDNIEDALVYLKQKGVKLRDETPRQGGGGAKIAFLEPESAFGVTLELVGKK